MSDKHPGLKRRTTSVLWLIKDFRSWINFGNELVTASQFFSDIGTKVKWRITLPIRCGHSWVEPTVVIEELEASRRASVAVTARLSIIDEELNETNEARIIHTFGDNLMELHFSKYVTRKALLDRRKKLLGNGDLIILCDLTVNNISARTVDNNNSNLTNSLQTILHNAFFSDFVVYVKDKMFPCHKCILASRSKWFAAYLNENKGDKLVLSNMEPDIFKAVRKYIYTDEASIPQAKVIALWFAGDHFHLKRLKIMCEQVLDENLCPENAMEVFWFASRTGLETLKMRSFFVLRNFGKTLAGLILNEINRSPHWANDSKSKASDSVTNNQASVSVKNLSPLTVLRKAKSVSKKNVFCNVQFFCRTERHALVPAAKYRIPNFKSYDLQHVEHFRSFIVNHKEGALLVRFVADESDFDIDTRVICVQFKFIPIKDENTPRSIQYELSIVSAENTLKETLRGSCSYTINTWSRIAFITIETILSDKNLLYENDLIVCCRFTTSKFTVYNYPCDTVPRSEMCDDLESVWHNKLFCDLQVNVKSRTFSCHKAIFACYSPYIMSNIQAISSGEKVLDIDGIEPDVFEKVLVGMYTGKCNVTEPELMELIPFTTRYQFSSSALEDAFVSALEIRNAARLLVFADSQKAEIFKTRALHFVYENLEEVIKTSEWSQVVERKHLFAACIKYIFSLENPVTRKTTV